MNVNCALGRSVGFDNVCHLAGGGCGGASAAGMANRYGHVGTEQRLKRNSVRFLLADDVDQLVGQGVDLGNVLWARVHCITFF